MNNIEIQQALIKWGFLDPPADGRWGTQSRAALEDFQRLVGIKVSGDPDSQTIEKLQAFVPPTIKLNDDFASKIVGYMQRQGHFIARGRARYNIVYVEGMRPDGTLNDDQPNEWNDCRLIIEIPDLEHPDIIGAWNGTTEPGDQYTYYPLNDGGAFRIAFGQFRAWCVGVHKDEPALVQVADIEGYRDANKDFQRTGDKLVKGLFGVNQHHGWDMVQVNNASAGCLVGRSVTGHRTFISLITGDRRYRVSHGYVFWTAIIPGDKL